MTVYSHTRLALYEKCPLAYKFRYIDKIKPEEAFISIEMFMGSRVHDTLEYVYKQRKKSPMEKITLSELLSYYDFIWKNKWADDVKVVKENMTAADYFDQGKLILSEYYHMYQPFDRDETLSVEERIDISIEGFKLMGFIDRLAVNKENGHVEIHDYKTSNHLPDISDLQNDRQLALYQIGVRKKYEFNDREFDIIYHFLRFKKEIRLQKSDDELEELKKKIVNLIQIIELASWENNFPACVGNACRWCEFSSVCPEFNK
ncbi:PD-(D/E)XK nuclease family protein [Methanolapillus millepedarum]|uniref:PD-(D/E)XK endonuclease-like domain-containing protein n=1 Tax=Methanolapillus millepedarum TaxID=3028296 RepID=A0AA96VC00_9EURY|nr:hypothetical protein MsAc7_09310 [Methanosarcinaceae archaeon Ac7]